jgi:hypothetical protein
VLGNIIEDTVVSLLPKHPPSEESERAPPGYDHPGDRHSDLQQSSRLSVLAAGAKAIGR